MTFLFTEAPAPDPTWAPPGLALSGKQAARPITLAPPGRPRFHSFNPTLRSVNFSPGPAAAALGVLCWAPRHPGLGGRCLCFSGPGSQTRGRRGGGLPSRLQLGPWPLMEVPAPRPFPWGGPPLVGQPPPAPSALGERLGMEGVGVGEPHPLGRVLAGAHGL